MGPIQSSLNQLALTAWGSVAAAAVMSKKMFSGKPQAQTEKKPTVKSEVTNSMGNNVKIGRVSRNKYMGAAATISANNAINEKAASSFFNVDDRVKEATSLTVKDIGGNE